MPQVDLFKQTSTPYPSPRPPPQSHTILSHPGDHGSVAAQCIYLHSLPSFHRNPTLTEPDSCHQTEKKKLAVRPSTRLPSPSQPPRNLSPRRQRPLALTSLYASAHFFHLVCVCPPSLKGITSLSLRAPTKFGVAS